MLRSAAERQARLPCESRLDGSGLAHAVPVGPVAPLRLLWCGHRAHGWRRSLVGQDHAEAGTSFRSRTPSLASSFWSFACLACTAWGAHWRGAGARGRGHAVLPAGIRSRSRERSALSSMAALGAVLSIFFGIAGAHPWTLPLCGVAGGVAAMAALLDARGPLGKRAQRWCCRESS